MSDHAKDEEFSLRADSKGGADVPRKHSSRMEKAAPQPDKPQPVQVGEQRESSRAGRQEFFIPVSGFVWLYPEEVKVVNHPAFQRLSRVYQLGQAHLVYRGATHKRIEHALGTIHIVHRMIEAVNYNGEKDPANSKLNLWEERFTRLGALLHDIGHLVAGHTVEDELGLLGRHDEDTRLTRVFEAEEWSDTQGRTLARLVDELFDKYMPPKMKGSGLSPSVVVRLLIRKRPEKEEELPFGKFQNILEGSSDIRLGVCRDMIGNTICADLLDYLHRDWYHVGKPRPFDDRLLQYMEVRKSDPLQVSPSAQDKFVISLGKRPNLHTDAISNILELLEWRYQLAESVLFHKTKLAAAAMLDRALYELWEGSKDDEDIEGFLLPLSDEAMLAKCREIAYRKWKPDRGSENQQGRVAHELLSRLANRQLFAHLCTRFYGDIPHVVHELEKTYVGLNGDKKSAASNRNRVIQVLEADFGLPLGTLAMYCPGNVNQKIAMVQIAVGKEILPFSKFEERHNKTGVARLAQLAHRTLGQ